MRTTACTWAGRDEVFESYVRDTLGPDDRDAFEAHYFSCETCFDKLRTFQALHAELRITTGEAPATAPVRARPWRWAFVPVAAGLVLLAAVALWLRSSAPVTPQSTVVVAPALQPSSAAPVPQPPAALPVPVQPQAAPPQAKSRASSPVIALSLLARVEPPVYVPVALRGPRDEAAEKFEAAMRLYVDGDYAGAIPGLTAAADLAPDASHVAFFLAICNLLTDRLEAAIVGLEKTIAKGESPYLEEAHFYMAKARLRQGDVTAARAELGRTIERRGRLEADARRLMAQLNAIETKR